MSGVAVCLELPRALDAELAAELEKQSAWVSPRVRDVRVEAGRAGRSLRRRRRGRGLGAERRAREGGTLRRRPRRIGTGRCRARSSRTRAAGQGGGRRRLRGARPTWLDGRDVRRVGCRLRGPGSARRSRRSTRTARGSRATASGPSRSATRRSRRRRCSRGAVRSGSLPANGVVRHPPGRGLRRHRALSPRQRRRRVTSSSPAPARSHRSTPACCPRSATRCTLRARAAPSRREGVAVTCAGRCFRYESRNLTGLRAPLGVRDARGRLPRRRPRRRASARARADRRDPSSSSNAGTSRAPSRRRTIRSSRRARGQDVLAA